MAKGYKIKTDDGSEVGPMNLEAVEGWYRQGLVRHDNLVQRPGSYNWVPLSEVLARDLKKAAPAKKAAAPTPRHSPQPARSEAPREAAPRAANTGLLKGLAALVVVAAGVGGGIAAYRAFLESPPGKAISESPSAIPVPSPDLALGKAIEAVTREAPHLSRAVAELLMAESAAQPLEPQEAFRRAHVLIGRGISSLPAAESRDLGGLMQAVYGVLPSRDQGRLAAYFDKLRARRVTTPQEDREMCLVMKGGVLKLGAARRARLQALFDKAIRAGAAARG